MTTGRHRSADWSGVVTIEPGTRLVLRTSRRAVRLRALGGVTLVGQWAVPVMAAAVTREPVRGRLELPVGTGAAVLEAELARDGPGMVLRAAAGTVPAGRAVTQVRAQRRSHVRAGLRLPVRAAVLDGPEAVEPGDDVEVLTGQTLNVAGGGLALRWDQPRALAPGVRLYLELAPQDGRLVPIVAQVVTAAANRRHVRVRFLDIAPADIERLVKLVFVAQRQEIAKRRR